MFTSETNPKERIKTVINSRLRSSGTAASFTYQLSKNIKRIKQAYIESIHMPCSFYNIKSSNNVLKMDSGAVTVTITAGIYNFATLKTSLQTAIQTAYGSGQTEVKFDSKTSKFTIVRTPSATIDITNSTLSPVLGFTSSTPTGTQAQQAADISGPKYLQIRSVFLTRQTHQKLLYVNTNFNNALDVIPVNVRLGDVIRDINNVPIIYPDTWEIKSTDSIDFEVYDDKNQLVNFNGVNWSIILVFITS